MQDIVSFIRSYSKLSAGFLFYLVPDPVVTSHSGKQKSQMLGRILLWKPADTECHEDITHNLTAEWKLTLV